MVRRDDIRYHTRWVRVLCCLAVGIGVANAVHFEILAPLEHVLRTLLIEGGTLNGRPVIPALELPIVLALAVIPAIPRVERPLEMIGLSACVLFSYLLCAGLSFLTAHWLPPMVSPLVALFGATTVLESMAWSEERLRRRTLEGLESARQRFNDMLVHDLKKRVSAILMSVSVLEKRTAGKQDDLGDVMTTIKASGERLVVLLDNLLDVHRLEEGGFALQKEPVDVRELLQGAVSEHADAAEMAEVKLVLEPTLENATIRVDRQLFTRVISNLVWNAIQHAKRGTHIEIGWRLRGQAVVLIHVANQGHTIPWTQHDSVFHPFVAGRNDATALHGTGLGLAFCRLAVTAHNGTIALESPWNRYGNGVKFTIRLPVAR